MRFETRSELTWLAFRYVTDALTSVEADAFEQRLDRDQAAREAVAEAVELSAAVAALPPNPWETLPAPRRYPVFRRAAQVTAALAACLLLGVGLSSLSHRPAGDNVAGRAGNSPRAVALIWSGLHEENAAEIGGSDDLLTWLDESSQPVEPEVLAAADPADATTGVPSWLWEAAALPQPEGPSLPDTQEN